MLRVPFDPIGNMKTMTESGSWGQFLPARTEDENLKNLNDEGARLRTVIVRDCAAHLPEQAMALHTGMRPSEQYGLKWTGWT